MGWGQQGEDSSLPQAEPGSLTPSDLPVLEDRVRFTAREPSGVAWREGMPGWSRHCEQGTYRLSVGVSP